MEDLTKVISVAARPAEVWKAWTTTDGLRSFVAPNSRIDLRDGGDLEILFDMSQPEGMRGSEGCVVVGIKPQEELKFTWNFPPSLPTIRGQHTVVTISFSTTGDGSGTDVTLRQSSFRDDGEWPAGRAYFDQAWDMVLNNLADLY